MILLVSRLIFESALKSPPALFPREGPLRRTRMTLGAFKQKVVWIRKNQTTLAWKISWHHTESRPTSSLRWHMRKEILYSLYKHRMLLRSLNRLAYQQKNSILLSLSFKVKSIKNRKRRCLSPLTPPVPTWVLTKHPNSSIWRSLHNISPYLRRFINK